MVRKGGTLALALALVVAGSVGSSEAQLQRAIPGTSFPATVRLHICTLQSNVIVSLGNRHSAFVHTVLVRATSEREAVLHAQQVDYVGDDWRVCSVTQSFGCRHYFLRDGIQCDPAE